VSSLFKNRILVIAAMQYGYLNPDIMKSYENTLSNNAKDLLSDINLSYKKNILPSKRQSFYTDDKSIFWSYIRPDYENIYHKNHLFTVSSLEGFTITKKEIINEFKKYERSISLSELNNLFNKINGSHQTIKENIHSIIINDFYLNGTTLGDYRNIYKSCQNLNASDININCLVAIMDEITYEYYYTRHDNSFYTKAALEVASNYNIETKKYVQHDNIEYITEILLSRPIIYIAQSMLTSFSMTGYVPIPSYMTSAFSNTYSMTILPEIFLYDFQKLYYLPINFWYIFCVLLIIWSFLFQNKGDEKNLTLFIAFTPLYYGLFISFANFAEFTRLLLPVIPMIILSYVKLYEKVPIAMSLVFILPIYLSII
jgi:hypothetical protein